MIPEKKTSGGKWKRLADKGEFIEKIASLNPILRGFVSKTECFVSKDGTQAVIKVPNAFTASVLSEADSMATLTDALVLCGAAEAGVTVKIELGEVTETEISLMDELEEL